MLESSDERSVIRTTFRGLQIGNKQFDLVQDWSLGAGQAWSEIHLKVLNGSLPKGMHFATGIVKHLPTVKMGEASSYFYSMNWGEQSLHKENMRMAILAEQIYKPEPVVDALNHAFVFRNAPQEVRYRFLAAWERDNNHVQNADEFKNLVESAAKD